jgi:hypothetical protein
VAPGVGICFTSRSPYWTLAAELGLRIWF